MIRSLRLALAVLVTLVAAVAVVRVAGPAQTDSSVRRQLAYLRDRLESGAGEDAQRLFPEGYFFAHVLYGLTAADLGDPAAARWALDRLDAPAGRAPFDPALTPAYGVFWAGWTNLLRGAMLAATPAAGRDPAQVARLADDSAALAAAFTASGTPFLTAYPDQSWPVDSTVAVASLSLHDAVLAPRFRPVVTGWLGAVRQRLDPATGLLPHRADPVTGAPIEGARGTSQSIVHRFLTDIDPVFAREQYLRFRELFVVTPPGLGPAVREFPAGTDGAGDVDSGPLILGTSLSATAVTLGAARVQGDGALAGALANYGDLLGMPVDTPWTRRYAFGALPIGDTFVAWSKSARPLVAAEQDDPGATVPWWWRVPILVLLILIGLAPWARGLRKLLARR